MDELTPLIKVGEPVCEQIRVSQQRRVVGLGRMYGLFSICNTNPMTQASNQEEK
jgi:hypothetical protein